MEIIVPAAGLSTRFPEMKPKYLLYDYKGDLMIRNAIRPYMDDYTIHIGILKEHDEKYNASELLKYELGEDIIIHILDEPTKGPADTVYQILKKADIRISPILIKDCDRSEEHTSELQSH